MRNISVGYINKKGKVPKGCYLCGKGAKMVVFTTGKCPFNCFYCPIANYRRGKDLIFANERPVKTFDDLLEEAKLMSALGAGITGGDPLYVDHTFDIISFLKEKLGNNFHIHLYTKINSKDRLEKAYNAGVDEIRFHFSDPKPALDFSWDVGAEIPVIPGQEAAIKAYIRKLEDLGVKFINLNQLEISDSNFENITKLGFETEDGYTVKGSEELAKKIILWVEEEGLDITVHYCSAKVKTKTQMRKRYLRAAKNIARKFEIITKEGTILVGVLPYNDKVLNYLRKSPYSFEIVGDEIHTSPKLIEKLECGELREYVPTYDKAIVERDYYGDCFNE